MQSLLQGLDNFKIEIHQCSGVSLTVLPILLPVREQTEANRWDTEGVLLFNYITSVTGHKANCWRSLHCLYFMIRVLWLTQSRSWFANTNSSANRPSWWLVIKKMTDKYSAAVFPINFQWPSCVIFHHLVAKITADFFPIFLATMQCLLSKCAAGINSLPLTQSNTTSESAAKIAADTEQSEKCSWRLPLLSR